MLKLKIRKFFNFNDFAPVMWWLLVVMISFSMFIIIISQ